MKKILIVTVILMTLFVTVIYADDINEEAPASSIFEDLTVETYKIEDLNINARSAIVMDFESGRVLFEKTHIRKDRWQAQPK
ncbi:hypothetical protein ODU73_001289 [Thermoclostridium stercorarium]|uniref:hypothetical protein n=1 Tax=Thermoclostridium stercorarium TaxID=1510 RepID=UPI00224901A5|nr:hypothetical protein [Thermoclostridium stercorarium]UZQ86801.1 hypothetical protein ODU73_001289 [Thermoclostridium stercorarium]